MCKGMKNIKKIDGFVAFFNLNRYLCNSYQKRFVMNRIPRIITLWTMLLCAVCLAAQNMMQVSGRVVDAQTGKPLSQATLVAKGTNIATVTNDDGVFLLKLPSGRARVNVSHMGYETAGLTVSENHIKPFEVKLKPTAFMLDEFVVWTEDPHDLIRIAVSKITDNYSKQPERYQTFYREMVKKRNRYISVAEGVVDMYKSAYGRNAFRDGVSIRKGRRIISSRQKDTLSVKVLGGPAFPIQLDVVKNLNFLLSEEELSGYRMSMGEPTAVDGRMQFVVKLEPAMIREYPLFNGTLYIDRQTLAFTQVELSLDVSDRQKATEYMLRKKPSGLRFRPKELSCVVHYRTGDDGITRISYVRNTFAFNCDWKRRLMATPFTAICEMVVTDHTQEGAKPLKGHDTFSTRDAFYDKVDFFLDPAYWEDYNIIPPTESLEDAIGRLMKKR